MSLDLPKLPQSFPIDQQIWWQQVVDAVEAHEITQDALIANLAATDAELTIAQQELEAAQLALQQAQADLQQAFTDILAAQNTADSAATAAATAQTTADTANTAATAAAADAASALAATSGLGTAANEDIGTSGATVPLLNGANTWSGAQLHTAAFGYTTGAGGTVTQLTSKSTDVTLNTLSGKITMHNAALAAGATVFFLLNNSMLGTDDILVPMITGVGTNGAYLCGVGSTASGIASICLQNVSGGSLSEAVEIGFIILKAVTS